MEYLLMRWVWERQFRPLHYWLISLVTKVSFDYLPMQYSYKYKFLYMVLTHLIALAYLFLHLNPSEYDLLCSCFSLTNICCKANLPQISLFCFYRNDCQISTSRRLTYTYTVDACFMFQLVIYINIDF